MSAHMRHTRGGKTHLLALQEAEAAKRLEATLQVLSQPHRRGDSSELRESALGRFVLDYECGRECYEAGLDYFRLVYKWRRAKGIQNLVYLDEVVGVGDGDLDGESVEQWFARIKECEFALRRAGMSGFRAANAMILEDAPPSVSIHPVKRALLSLAIEMGRFPY